MKISDVLALPSMPLQSPTFARGPFRFIDRQYMSISYESDPAAIAAALPQPLVADGNRVSVQWLDLPDGEGFGAYAAVSQVIPCLFGDEPCTFVSQMYVDNAPPLAAGREIWGYPMKFGKPKLEVTADTLTGTLSYSGQTVAVGTMAYKHDAFFRDHAHALLTRTQITLKLVPDIDGSLAIAQLVGVNFSDVHVKGAWAGRARLSLNSSVNCPLADLPVLGDVGGAHMVTDMTLPYGRVLHDYLA
jgi:acetoacetate decarboxylase